MYVCICQGFTESQVRDVSSGGCSSMAEAYRRLSGGEPPQCGKCLPVLRDLLRGSAATVSGPAGPAARPVYATAAE